MSVKHKEDSIKELSQKKTLEELTADVEKLLKNESDK